MIAENKRSLPLILSLCSKNKAPKNLLLLSIVIGGVNKATIRSQDVDVFT